MKIAVIGIGQKMRGDDRAGLEAVRRWQRDYPKNASRPGVIVETSELPGLNLLQLIGDSDAVILVDAVQSGSPPGTIHHLDPDQLSAFSGTSQSAHGWGVSETLGMGNKLNLLAQDLNIKIIGMEAGQTDIGSGLSKEIEMALPALCAAIEETLQSILA